MAGEVKAALDDMKGARLKLEKELGRVLAYPDTKEDMIQNLVRLQAKAIVAITRYLEASDCEADEAADEAADCAKVQPKEWKSW